MVCKIQLMIKNSCGVSENFNLEFLFIELANGHTISDSDLYIVSRLF